MEENQKQDMCKQKILYKVKRFGWTNFTRKRSNRLVKGVDKYCVEEYDY